MTKAWSRDENLSASIVSFMNEATHWNKNQFGNIFGKKMRLMARLNGIQRVLASNPSSYLIALENQLQNELELVLSQESKLWALKSRINWMVMGGRNTSFYHVSALASRKRKTITMVKNEVRDWLSEEREVMTHFREGFIRLYSTTQVKADWRHNLRHGWQVSLTKEEKNN